MCAESDQQAYRNINVLPTLQMTIIVSMGLFPCVTFTGKETMPHSISKQTGSSHREAHAAQLDTRQDIIFMVKPPPQQELG